MSSILDHLDMNATEQPSRRASRKRTRSDAGITKDVARDYFRQEIDSLRRAKERGTYWDQIEVLQDELAEELHSAVRELGEEFEGQV